MPCAAEACGGACGVGKCVDFVPDGAGDGSEDGLCDPHAGFDGEGVLAGVHEDHLQFPPVVFVDGGGGVGEGDAMLEGEA